jgi:hypothetical protein
MPSRLPIGWNRLRSYQKEDATLLAERVKVGEWAPPGVGKSALILAALMIANVSWPVLIVTKSLGRRVWPRDARWVLGADYVPGIVDGLSARPGVNYHDEGVHADDDWSPHHSPVQPVTYSSVAAALDRHPAVVVSYEVMERPDLWTVPWGAFILDEAHAIKGGYLAARKRVRKSDGKLGWSGTSARYELCRDMARLVRARGGPVWELTATPTPDRRRDLFGQLNIALPNMFPESLPFLRKFCDYKQKRIFIGGEARDVPDSTGKSNDEELKAILSRYFIVHSREQLADQLPRMQLDTKVVQAAQNSVRHIGGDIETAIARAALSKIPAGLEIASDYLSTGGKVVLTVTRRELAHQLDARVKSEKFLKTLPRVVRERLVFECLTGEVPALERSGRLNDFNEMVGRPGVLVATSDSLLESIDLHKVHAAIILGLPYSPGQVEQLLGRFSRLGGLNVVIHFVVAEGTIDDRIKELVLDKLTDSINLGADTQGGTAIKESLKTVRDEHEVMNGLRAWLNSGGAS